MNLAALIAEYRRRADDEVAPFFAEDAPLIGYANEAVREACVRARLLFDDAPRPGVTTYDVQPGQERVELGELVHWIEAASFIRADGREFELDLTGLDWIREHPDWRRKSASRPKVLADDGRERLRMWPTPSGEGTLQLAVYRFPLKEMAADDDTPEIRTIHHVGLVDWMLYRQWSRPEADAEDQQKAGLALAQFERTFGTRDTADVMRKHRERKRVTTTYGGIR